MNRVSATVSITRREKRVSFLSLADEVCDCRTLSDSGKKLKSTPPHPLCTNTRNPRFVRILYFRRPSQPQNENHMATSSDGPTPDQIKKVQTNLTNMLAFNDQVYNFGLAKYLNAYALLSEHDDNDLGLAIGLNIIEGAFWAAGSVAGPAGSFLASFLSGMVAYWMTDTPPSLNTAFAQNVLRFQATTEQVDANLATYFQDVPDNWHQSFHYNR